MSRENTIVLFPGQHALDEVSYAFLQIIGAGSLDDGQLLLQCRNRQAPHSVTLRRMLGVEDFIRTRRIGLLARCRSGDVLSRWPDLFHRDSGWAGRVYG